MASCLQRAVNGRRLPAATTATASLPESPCLHSTIHRPSIIHRVGKSHSQCPALASIGGIQQLRSGKHRLSNPVNRHAGTIKILPTNIPRGSILLIDTLCSALRRVRGETIPRYHCAIDSDILSGHCTPFQPHKFSQSLSCCSQ
jgi:hypothetical protein